MATENGASHPYGPTIAEHFRWPHNQRVLAHPDARAEGVNALCGDRVRIELAASDDGARIADAAFTANACAICVAAASLLTDRVRGLAVTAAATVSDDDVVASLEAPLPAGRRRCATLPAETLRAALAGLGAR